ncbi:MAG: molybdopterin molybdotransferase MoeA [Aphanocapsa sp. GSE-SYN-MK-11-07L]|jgi:molybdopterin molybdotransferase|nr:molybdopterin molybdotransferase MoeA [Aphanocapsa sp. GSE-SYN-MK-11-07L]
MHSPLAAEQIILNLVQPLTAEFDQEWVDLGLAGDRILATAITSPLDFPYWDNSAMDGYAVRFADVSQARAEQPVGLEIIEEIPAGYAPQQTVQVGQAARLFTGSMLPAGADTVVMQEQTQRQGNQVQILAAPKLAEFVRPRGAYYQAGSSLLSAGMRLNAPELAVLATVQSVQVPVYRRPVVAILSTGSELIAPDQPLALGQIVDSNQYALAQLAAQTGAEVKLMPRVGDRPDALKLAIQSALDSADLVLSSGGVSVGDYDFVDRSLAELGAEIHIRSVAVRPGKPLTVATFPPEGVGERPRLYFGLPGNPVSALVSFWRFVQPALRKLSGLAEGWGPFFVQATTRQPLQGDQRREAYFWGQLYLVNGRYEFGLAAGNHSSGNLINLAQTNGLAVVSCAHEVSPKENRPHVAAGESIQVLQVGMPTLPKM